MAAFAADPEADGRVVGRDADLGHAIPGRQVHGLGLDVRLAPAKQVDLAMEDDPVDPAPRTHPRQDLLVEHHPHLGGDSRQAGKRRLRRSPSRSPAQCRPG